MIKIKEAELILETIKNIYESEEKKVENYNNFSIKLEDKTKEEQIKNIEKAIILLNQYYYTFDKPLVQDDIYDTLKEDYLEKLDPENYLLEKIGETIKEFDNNTEDYFKKSKHDIIAGSQNKIRNNEEEKFNEQIEEYNTEVTISDKMDGITLVVTYINEKEKGFEYIYNIYEYHKNYIKNSKKPEKEKDELLKYITKQKTKIISMIKNTEEGNYFPYKIVTRGDGIIGEDITINAIDIKGINKQINKKTIEEISNYKNNKKEIIIRGEALITIKDFEGLPYKNPRNGVATIRKQNGRHRDKITFIPFERIINNIEEEELNYPNRKEMYDWFKKENFYTPYYEKFNNLENMKEAIKKRLIERNNEKINYWIDGIIISIDNVEERTKLGMIGKKPKGEFAIKPAPERAIGEIEEIIFTVGKTGNITPVAKLKDKILISGSEIQYISLANEEIMKEISPAKGTKVEIVKRGEIIPKIEANLDLENINKKIEDFIVQNFLETNLLTAKTKNKIRELYHQEKISKLFNKNIKINFKNSFNMLRKEILTTEEEEKININKKYKELEENFLEENKDLFDKKINNIIINKINYPNSCPSCEKMLEKGKVLIKCTNKDCKEKNIAQLTFFAQKLTKEIGIGIIKQLYEKNILKNYSDFFKIKKEDFINEKNEYIEGWKESSINIFLDSVKKIKISKDNEFLSSLFFENIGSDKFLKLFQKITFKEVIEELNKIEEKIPEELEEIKTTEKFIKELEKIKYPNIDIVKKISEIESWGAIGIVKLINLWIEEKEQLKELLNNIKIIPTEIIENIEEELKVVITGTIDYIPEYMEEAKGKSKRDKLKNYLKSKGHKSPGSVSANTTCLVSDTISTTGKFKDAQQRNIPILNSKEFIEKYQNILNKEENKIKKIIKNKISK